MRRRDGDGQQADQQRDPGGERLAAAPGGRDYGVLAVVLASLFEIELVRTVPASELAKAEGAVTCCSLLLRESGIDKPIVLLYRAALPFLARLHAEGKGSGAGLTRL